MSETKKRKFSIKTDFNKFSSSIIPIAVIINFIGSQLASLLKLPIYLDTIGTIFAAMLCGPWVGAVAGILTNICSGLVNPVYFAFIPVNLAMGLVVGFFSRGDMFSVWWKWCISMVVMAFLSIFISAPIIVYVFNGITGGGTSIITATLIAIGTDIWAASFVTECIFTVFDRIISCVLSLFVIKAVPDTFLMECGCGQLYIKE